MQCTCRPGFGDFGSGCVAEVPGCTNRMPATLTAKQMWTMAAASSAAATEVFEAGECTCRPGFGDFGSGCVGSRDGLRRRELRPSRQRRWPCVYCDWPEVPSAGGACELAPVEGGSRRWREWPRSKASSLSWQRATGVNLSTFILQESMFVLIKEVCLT